MRNASRFPWSADRGGLTVVEVLVALVLLSVGLLGLAGSSALSLRVAESAARERRAIDRARSRLAALSASPCGTAATGRVHVAPDLDEWWTVGSPSAGLAAVDVGVRWQAFGRPRSLTLAGAVLC
jgi:Tfp pilus assembly protein PilV